MTYRGMSFYSRSLSSSSPINYARHDPLLIVMRLAQVARCCHYGYSPCGSQVCISTCRPRRYLVPVRLHHVSFRFIILNSQFAVLGVACFAFSQVPLWLSHKPTNLAL